MISIWLLVIFALSPVPSKLLGVSLCPHVRVYEYSQGKTLQLGTHWSIHPVPSAWVPWRDQVFDPYILRTCPTDVPIGMLSGMSKT